MKNEILMPINQDFLDVFDVFMDEEQRIKIRANNVRQYAEGIIDLLLKDKIKIALKPNEPYEGINWGRKIKILKENYDEEIANDIQEIFRIGGDSSHFNGKVKEEELQLIIQKAIHIVENIFVKYFLSPEHKFGNEDIYTIFSMLPLRHRIYILEKISEKYTNQDVVDRLSLAYVKNGEEDKAYKLLEEALRNEIINIQFYECKRIALNVLSSNLSRLYEINKDYAKDSQHPKALMVGEMAVVGFPTPKDVFDTAKAVSAFNEWFEQDKDRYPEFINLFLYLMQTDTRQYE